jgi:hypothetical protein
MTAERQHKRGILMWNKILFETFVTYGEQDSYFQNCLKNSN